MTTADHIAEGRAAFARRAWTAAYDAYRANGVDATLEHDDLERLGIAAQLIGHDDVAEAAWGRAHRAAMSGGDDLAAARDALRIGMMLVNRGEMARGGTWLGRATRLVDASGVDCVERGFVLVPQGIQQLDSGEPEAAFATFERIAGIGKRFGNADLGALGGLGRGRASIDLGDIATGVALLDEAMLVVTTGDVSPIIVGSVYCASVDAFWAIFDLRRAQEWTEALAAWCEDQPDLVPFRGRCLVFRAELKQLHGDWVEAFDDATRAQEWLSRPPPEPAVGEAFYEQAELHRLRGEFAKADAAYREAMHWGRRPEPGLALLRLAQGQRDGAHAMIRRAIDEASDEIARARLLAPSGGDRARGRRWGRSARCRERPEPHRPSHGHAGPGGDGGWRRWNGPPR
jgi:tetratricopeptide (TPR) repeat protein